MRGLADVLTGDVLEVAPRLLNAVLRNGDVAVRITEVEAYDGPGDPGSHAHNGRTNRNAVMFGPAGRLYVYFTYGMHYCCNVTAGPEGSPSAVLLRAGEVVDGMDTARDRRRSSDRDLARGPARLCQALGLDLSQQMLNIARRNVTEAGLTNVELRHGDIFDTRLPEGAADLVVVHQVLHYLGDPSAAVKEAGRIVAPGGKLIIVDFAPHKHEFLREQHQHRRLGFSDEEIARWLAEADLPHADLTALPPTRADGLTVKIWAAQRAPTQLRSAA